MTILECFHDLQISKLEEVIFKKDIDMQSMEERYKKYIEKAKSVIKTLDPKQNPNAVPEVSALRKQLNEKDALIETLEQVKKRYILAKHFVDISKFHPLGNRKGPCCSRNGRAFNFLGILQLVDASSQVYGRQLKPSKP